MEDTNSSYEELSSPILTENGEAEIISKGFSRTPVTRGSGRNKVVTRLPHRPNELPLETTPRVVVTPKVDKVPKKVVNTPKNTEKVNTITNLDVTTKKPNGRAPKLDGNIPTPTSVDYTKYRKFPDKKPSLSNYPTNISKVGLKDYWKGFCEKYSSKWKTFISIDESWACAIAIWRNYALKRDVPPFDASPSVYNEDLRNELMVRFRKARKESVSSLQAIFAVCKKAGLFTTLMKERLLDITFLNGYHTIRTWCKVKLNKELAQLPTEKVILDNTLAYNLMHHGFKRETQGFRKPDKYTKDVRASTKLIFTDNDDSVGFMIQVKLTAQHYSNLIGFTTAQMKSPNSGGANKAMGKLQKQIMKQYPVA